MGQTLDEMRQFVTDGLIAYLANSEPNDKPRNRPGTITDAGAAQMLARQSHCNRFAVQFWKVAERAFDHVEGTMREALFHERCEGERHGLVHPCAEVGLQS
jgi:hypothetical protein